MALHEVEHTRPVLANAHAEKETGCISLYSERQQGKQSFCIFVEVCPLTVGIIFRISHVAMCESCPVNQHTSRTDACRVPHISTRCARCNQSCGHCGRLLRSSTGPLPPPALPAPPLRPRYICSMRRRLPCSVTASCVAFSLMVLAFTTWFVAAKRVVSGIFRVNVTHTVLKRCMPSAL